MSKPFRSSCQALPTVKRRNTLNQTRTNKHEQTYQEFRTKAEMQSSTLVAIDDIMDMLPRIGEPLPEVEV